jgi:hypothetical protein
MNTKTARISEYDDIIDSRRVLSVIEELRAKKEAYPKSFKGDEELTALETLSSEAEEFCEDWRDGAILIRNTHFTEYVRDLLHECGDIPKELPHYVRIDWEATAREMMADYTKIYFGDSVYWGRCAND